jgi:hypothetical protein
MRVHGSRSRQETAGLGALPRRIGALRHAEASRFTRERPADKINEGETMNGEMLRIRWLLAATIAFALSSVTVPASAGQRSLTDFTSRQMAWCAAVNDEGTAIDCAASHYGRCKDGEFTSTFPLFWSDPKSGNVAGIDVLDQLSPGEFGTSLNGSVSESARPDGLAEVNIVLHSSNALMVAFDGESGELLLGSGLGDALAQIKLSNTAPGAPLPDINQVLSCPEPGQALETLSMRARASGPLHAAFGVPEGTPGRLEVTQTGLIGTAALVNPNSRLAVGGFPAEHVIIRATGK